MNLHAIVTNIISQVNPPQVATLLTSTGYATNADGTRVPGYLAPLVLSAQVQALTAKEVQHLDSLNIQGIMRGVYLNGSIEGANRRLVKGGDLLKFGGQTWLVVQVLETWDTDGWCKVAVAMQTDGP
jgi:hypothetical protein